MFAEEMYRAVNCVVRYTKSSIHPSKGLFFRYRVSQLLGQNFFREIFVATCEYITLNDFDVLESALYPFKVFRKGMQFTATEREMLKEILSIHCLRDWSSNINWDSNLLDSDWNPEKVVIQEQEFTLWQGDNLARKAPFRFRKWLLKSVQPHKDPMAFLLFVLRRLGLFDASFLKCPFNYAIFSATSPRYSFPHHYVLIRLLISFLSPLRVIQITFVCYLIHL
jgi:hypothetical protein